MEDQALTGSQGEGAEGRKEEICLSFCLGGVLWATLLQSSAEASFKGGLDLGTMGCSTMRVWKLNLMLWELWTCVLSSVRRSISASIDVK